ncbi:argininosuccinate synthase [Acrasis kona]|uniref:Argininosuccinate synthase n=1 Tax=Acrasis kona TaxID=1008807 RepID=A0AAW2YXL2_9EUKA
MDDTRARALSFDKTVIRVNDSTRNSQQYKPTIYSGTAAPASDKEEYQPILQKVQQMRLQRLSLVVHCTLIISVVILIISIIAASIGISTFVYTIVFPYHNYNIVKLNTDSAFPIDAGVAVASISGTVRMGSGFNFVYQRASHNNAPSFPLQVQPISFYPRSQRLVLIHNSVGDDRLFATLIDDNVGTTVNSSLHLNQTPTIYDSQPLGGGRFVTLYSIETADELRTVTSLYIMTGTTIAESIYFDSDPFRVTTETRDLISRKGSIYTKLSVLDDNRITIMYHYQDAQCIIHSLEFSKSNSTWTMADPLSLKESCRTGNISPLGENQLVIATETSVRVLQYTSRGVEPQPPAYFTCKPSYFTHQPTDDDDSLISKIDVKATAGDGFLLSCTWHRSAAALYGVAKLSGTAVKITLGGFTEFANDVTGDVKLSASYETSNNKYSVFATYQSNKEYRTIRCATMESRSKLFVSYSVPYDHLTFVPSSGVMINGTEFKPCANVIGVERYGVMFVSTLVPTPGQYAVFDIELARWNGGVKWAGVSISSDKDGSAMIVQKGIASGHSGLVPGSGYYADVTGVLTLSKTSTYVGIARSETEIMIDDDFVK